MDERRLDEKLLMFASMGRICCKLSEAVLKYWEEQLRVSLDLLVKEHIDKVVVNVRASLDVPTFDDRVVKGALEGATGESGGCTVAWRSLSAVIILFTSAARLVTEFGVLAKVIGSQQDGIYFAILHLGQELSKIFLVPEWSFSRAYG